MLPHAEARSRGSYCLIAPVLLLPFAGKKMPIGLLTLEIYIPEAHSLKDKRQVLRSLKDGLRAHFNVSVAELESVDVWQRATVGVVSISDSKDYLRGLMENVERSATRIANNAGAEIVDSLVEFI